MGKIQKLSRYKGLRVFVNTSHENPKEVALLKAVDITEDCPSGSPTNRCILLYYYQTDNNITVNIVRPKGRFKYRGGRFTCLLEHTDALIHLAGSNKDQFEHFIKDLGFYVPHHLVCLMDRHAPEEFVYSGEEYFVNRVGRAEKRNKKTGLK